MPREIVHWLVLEKACQEEPYLTNLLASYPEHLYLGTLAHDAPYYFNFGKSPTSEKLGDSLHGAGGEDTFNPIKELLNLKLLSKKRNESESISAVSIGLLLHIIVDATFHPMISYVTGDWYQRDLPNRSVARKRHKLFEVYLDSYFINKIKLNRSPILWDLVYPNSSRTEDVSEILSKVISAPPDYSKESKTFWQTSFQNFAYTQRAFRSNMAGFLYRLGSKMKPNLKENDAAFSFLRRGNLKLFDSAIPYKNPITGKDFNHSVQELFDMCIANFKNVYTEIKLAIESPAFDGTGLLTSKGPSLDYQEDQVRSDNAMYFRPFDIE